MRDTYLNNRLGVPGAVVNCGVPVDLGKVQLPHFILATREDHIVPWRAAYRSVHLLGGEKTFVLGASGHVAGVVNPPDKKRVITSYSIHYTKLYDARRAGRIRSATVQARAARCGVSGEHADGGAARGRARGRI